MIFTFKRAPLACLVSLALPCIIQPAAAREYFNPALLEVDNPAMKGTDLSSFEEGAQAEGKYRVDIILNEQVVDTREITFKSAKNANGDEQLQPCLSVALLKNWGVKTQLFPALGESGECADLSAIPKASTKFMFNEQKLLLSIPQAALSPQARGTVAPELWDEGIAAFLLNYNLSGDHTYARNSGAQDSNSKHANLRPGINIGPWRLRNYTTWSRSDEQAGKWDTVYSYVQRDIVALKSQLTLGDSSSPSDVFDSIPFRGGQLATDDDMLPDSLKGYAPVVRGIARTNAQVIIRQNGYVIYQSYVAPGAFEINDMYPTGGSGDLNVTVKEADGTQQNFVVPFASVPVLQREGHLKYSVTGGQYRSYNSNVEKTSLVQGTAIYGLAHGFTAYGGLQASSPYKSVALGVGKNMGDIGALSMDVIAARAQPVGVAESRGQSWRVRYSKDFTQTGTNFSIAGYRYSTAGYYGMQEVLDSYGDSSALNNRRRNRAELTVSQTMGDMLGSLTVSAIKEDYWNSGKSMASYSLGYNNSWRGISYGINYTYSKNGQEVGDDSDTTYDKDRIISLNVSVPLDKFLKNTWMNYSMNSSEQGSTTRTLGMSGTSLESNALSWNVQQSKSSDDTGYSGNVNADYRGTYGEVTGGYGYDKDTDRVHLGLNGGVMVHSGGVTLAQPFGETVALVDAPGVKGVHIANQTGVHTGMRGYTVVSNISAYRKNDISLDTATLPDNVELALTTKTVIPTRGAVVRASFKANLGLRALVTLTRTNGQPVPFGATVTIKEPENTQAFIVGDGGQVYLSGLSDKAVMNVQWGDDSNKQCVASFDVNNAQTNDSQIYQATARCQLSGNT